MMLKKIKIIFTLIICLFIITIQSENKSFAVNNTQIQTTTFHPKISLEELSNIKTFLRDNKNTITFISKSAYLQGKIGIKTDNLLTIAEKFPTMSAFKDVKYLIELVAQDIKNTKEINNFVKDNTNKNFKNIDIINKTLEELDNRSDLNTRSKEELWSYNVTLENEKKLIELDDILTQKSIDLENKAKWVNDKQNNSKTISYTKINSDNSKTRSITYSWNDSWDNAKVELTIGDNSIQYIIYFWIFILIIFIIYTIVHKNIKISSTIDINKTIQKDNNTEKNENQLKENTLQILKSENEYIIEYNGIYNKWIKVWEQNKKNITASIYNYVHSVSKLQVRWKDLFEELKNLDIKIPDLKESWNTLYRLYLPENIRESLQTQTGKDALVIKTDEQEIPWEIMHDNNNFLSLKFPISRKIMTRENIRKNNVVKNKIPKILFITNPTWDLNGTIQESKEIISKIWKKAEITFIYEKDVTSTKIFSLLWQDNWDIIHYSWHAYFDTEHPDNSWLILHDSIITASEIKRVLNGNPLIFLNACSSGRNDDKDFEKTWEDTIGTASSFLIGWAKWVIATLWPVNDTVSSHFAIDFYNLFLNNYTIWNAMLSSKKEAYINFPNDITWASFIYYWDPNLTLNV